MSLQHKLSKYINKPNPLPPISSRTSVPILLSDSKGRYLRDVVSNRIQNDIKFYPFSGHTSSKTLQWVEENLASKVESYGNVSLYVWTGTCDFTVKGSRQHLSVNPDPHVVTKFSQNLKAIKRHVKSFGHQACVTFLEVPIYSINRWNVAHGHDDTDPQTNIDLSTLLQDANLHVQHINDSMSKRSPKFTLDLLNTRRVGSGNRPGRRRAVIYDYDMYLDGIHPGPLLSKYWLRKIQENIQATCFS